MRKHKRSHSENRNERGPVRMKTKSADISNIYRLDGRVPAAKAIPFGLQHILAMFAGKYRSDTHRSRSQRSEQRPEREAHPKRDDYRRHRYTGPAVPSVAHRLRTADRHGHQLYLCLGLLLYRARLRLQRDHGRSHRRRLN